MNEVWCISMCEQRRIQTIRTQPNSQSPNQRPQTASHTPQPQPSTNLLKYVHCAPFLTQKLHGSPPSHLTCSGGWALGFGCWVGNCVGFTVWGLEFRFLPSARGSNRTQRPQLAAPLSIACLTLSHHDALLRRCLPRSDHNRPLLSDLNGVGGGVFLKGGLGC